jgi:hypothetical protein
LTSLIGKFLKPVDSIPFLEGDSVANIYKRIGVLQICYTVQLTINQKVTQQQKKLWLGRMAHIQAPCIRLKRNSLPVLFNLIYHS